MDKHGNVLVSLTPQMASVLAENLPESELEEMGVDVESTRKRLENAAGGNDTPTDQASLEQGFDVSGGNARTGVWEKSESATPSQYEHGYARGMESSEL